MSFPARSVPRRLSSLVVLVIACSAKRPPVPAHGLHTPLGLASVSPSARGSVRASPSQVHPDWAPEHLVPLLADPRLAAVAEAVEADRPRAAAVALEQAMSRARLGPSEVARWQYLLGKLRERAGDLRGAAASFSLAASEDSPLSGYARLGAARNRIALGELRVAETELGQVPPEPPLVAHARELLAELALLRHQPEQAVGALRTALPLTTGTVQRTRLSLRLAEALLERSRTAGRASQARIEDLVEALQLSRMASLERVDPMLAPRAERVEQQVLAALPEPERARRGQLSPTEQLARINALFSERQLEAVEQTVPELLRSLSVAEQWGKLGCEARLLLAKAAAGRGARGRAIELLEQALARCRDDDWRARALYLAGTYSAREGRHLEALRRFRQLEQELPGHELADDARVKAAQSHLELGDEAEFVRVLAELPERYPQGDQVLEGLFLLALRRMERNDWAGAASVLDQCERWLGEREPERGSDLCGRERYFRARAWIVTGEPERGYRELERIVNELPLSYYMLQALSRIRDHDPERAARVLREAIWRSEQETLGFEPRPDFSRPGFLRARELLVVGEIELAQRELELLWGSQGGFKPQLLWYVALLYARAGATKIAYSLARQLPTEWLRHWPVGDWRQVWELAFPRPFARLVEQQARNNGLSEALVYAVMREESAFDPEATSWAGAHGLMQLLVSTARTHARPLGLPSDPRSLKIPAINLALGCRTLAELQKQFGDNPVLAIPAYNAGPGRPRRWLRERPHQDLDLWVELIPFSETRRYTKRVLASRATYAYLYQSSGSEQALVLPLRLVPRSVSGD